MTSQIISCTIALVSLNKNLKCSIRLHLWKLNHKIKDANMF